MAGNHQNKTHFLAFVHQWLINRVYIHFHRVIKLVWYNLNNQISVFFRISRYLLSSPALFARFYGANHIIELVAHVVAGINIFSLAISASVVATLESDENLSPQSLIFCRYNPVWYCFSLSLYSAFPVSTAAIYFPHLIFRHCILITHFSFFQNPLTT